MTRRAFLLAACEELAERLVRARAGATNRGAEASTSAARGSTWSCRVLAASAAGSRSPRSNLHKVTGLPRSANAAASEARSSRLVAGSAQITSARTGASDRLLDPARQAPHPLLPSAKSM